MGCGMHQPRLGACMRGELFQAVFCPGSSCFELTLGHASDLPGPPPLPSTPCTSSTCACPGLRGMQMGGRMVCAANRSRSCVPGRACAGAVCVECVDMWIWAHVRLCARTCALARVGRCRQRLCTHARTHARGTHARRPPCAGVCLSIPSAARAAPPRAWR